MGAPVNETWKHKEGVYCIYNKYALIKYIKKKYVYPVSICDGMKKTTPVHRNCMLLYFLY